MASGQLQGVGSGGSLQLGDHGLRKLLRDTPLWNDDGPLKDLLRKTPHRSPKEYNLPFEPLKRRGQLPFGKKPLPKLPIPGPGMQLGRYGRTFLKGAGILGALDFAYQFGGVFLPAHGYFGGVYDLSGWTMQCNVGYPPNKEPAWIRYLTGTSTIGCSQAALDVPSAPYGATVPSGMRQINIGQDNSVGPVDRMGRNESYTRPNIPPFPEVPFIPITYGPWPEPVWRMPPVQKTPLPRTPPYGPPIPPYAPPPTPPGFGPPHKEKKPNKKEKEEKGKVPLATWMTISRRIAGMLSEGEDYLDAVFKALPRWAQFNQGYPPGSPYFNKAVGKGNAIYRYMGSKHVDQQFVKRVAQNLLENEIEDRILGKIGKKSRDLVRKNPYWKSPVGYQAGGQYRGYTMGYHG